MIRFKLFLAALLLAFVGLGGCATTGEQVSGAEQEKLEKEYNALRAERDKIKGQAKKVSAQNPALYKKATALEKKRKIGSKKSICVVPAGQGASFQKLTLGPLKLDHKKKAFNVGKGATKKAASMNYYHCTLKVK